MSNSTPTYNVLRNVLRGACVSYTVIVLFLCFVITGLSEETASAVAPMNFLLVFPFCICFSVANYVHRNTRLGGFLKFLVHLLLTVGGFFCFMYLPAFSGSSQSSSMVVLAVFLVCYLIVYGFVLLFRKRWKKEICADEEYVPKFAGKDATKRSDRR